MGSASNPRRTAQARLRGQPSHSRQVYAAKARYTFSDWRSFLRSHAEGIAAIDMFVVASASFRLLYVMIILAHDRRKIVRTAVTEHPTAAWLSRQVTEAFPWDTAPRYLLRDRDASYGSYFCNRIEAMGITQVVTAARSPWQNAYVERVNGSIRRECLDHIVILQRASSAPPSPVLLSRLLPSNPDASFPRQGLSGPTPDHATPDRKGYRHCSGWRPASSLRTPRRLILFLIPAHQSLHGSRYAVV
jgi:transposase InsO family protein